MAIVVSACSDKISQINFRFVSTHIDGTVNELPELNSISLRKVKSEAV